MDKRKRRAVLSEEMKTEITAKLDQGKGCKIISKQFDVLVTTVTNIIRSFYGSMARFPACSWNIILFLKT